MENNDQSMLFLRILDMQSRSGNLLITKFTSTEQETTLQDADTSGDW